MALFDSIVVGPVQPNHSEFETYMMRNVIYHAAQSTVAFNIASTERRWLST